MLWGGVSQAHCRQKGRKYMWQGKAVLDHEVGKLGRA